jgi:hypothetical protein
MSTIEVAYRYRQPSTVDVGGGRADLRLATSGGTTATGPAPHPYFFDGFAERPEQTAAGLLAVARVARSRFYTPPGMVAAAIAAADPVVTSNGDRLRFESFSACCGVYCRLDLLPAGLDRPPRTTGTTNVDVNPPLRQALAGIGGLDPLHLAVGADELTVTTTAVGQVVERRVPLPQRWLKGFAEVQLASAAMTLRHELPAVEARRFLQSLPRTPGPNRDALWAVPATRGMRLTTRPTTHAVCLPGPQRLRPLEPLLRYATTLRVHGPDPATGAPALPSCWQLDLPGARATIVLSPDLSRGFSGEGGVLHDLANDQASDDADIVAALLAFQPALEPDRLARGSGLSHAHVARALTHLAAAGRVGYDLAEAAHFHRELPYDPATLEAMHPRLRDARTLVDAGHIHTDGDLTHVHSGDSTYLVRHTADGDHCTCPWYGKHKTHRGPCKHILAANLARRPKRQAPADR